MKNEWKAQLPCGSVVEVARTNISDVLIVRVTGASVWKTADSTQRIYNYALAINEKSLPGLRDLINEILEGK